VDALIDATDEGGAGDNVAVVVLGRAPAGPEVAAPPATQSQAPSPVRGRIRGGLLGGAVGDALGAGIEFDGLDRIRRRFGPEGLKDPAPAYGRDSAITDDTQLALFTAEGLLRTFTRYATKGIAHPPTMVDMAYSRWLVTQGEQSLRHPPQEWHEPGRLGAVRGLSARRGPGKTTIAAVRGATAGELDAPTNSSKGSGGVARTAPIGLVGDPSNAFRLACECAVLAHGHPTGYLAAGALGLVVASLREGVALRPALGRALGELESWEGHEETTQALNLAIELAEFTNPTPEVVAHLGKGWVADEALAIAVYCALQARDLEHGLLLAVNHGGASPTTGAICGAILGTLHGGDATPTAGSPASNCGTSSKRSPTT
jgi:ADP-ribosylglycohydrolase